MTQYLISHDATFPKRDSFFLSKRSLASASLHFLLIFKRLMQPVIKSWGKCWQQLLCYCFPGSIPQFLEDLTWPACSICPLLHCVIHNHAKAFWKMKAGIGQNIVFLHGLLLCIGSCYSKRPYTSGITTPSNTIIVTMRKPSTLL